MTSHRVQCPADACGAIFDVVERRLGHNVYCPDCGARMTARPADLVDELRRRERRVADSAGVPGERLPLVALLDNVRSLWNVGSIFRTADACGVEQLVLAGISGHPPRAEIAKTALGAEEVVPWIYRADAPGAAREIRGRGYVPVALESSAGSQPLDSFQWPERPCLVVGNEVAGVSPSVLELCEHHVRIPMRGIKHSLNVAVAFGIAAHRAATTLESRTTPSLGHGR